MNCQHCNTELTNKRAKNCQTCTAILADANKRGVYGFVMDAISQAKVDGLTGDAMHETMRSAVKFGQSKVNEWKAEYRQRQQQRKEQDSQNIKFYQEHGYWPWQTGDVEDTRSEIEEAKNFKPRTTVEPEIYG